MREKGNDNIDNFSMPLISDVYLKMLFVWCYSMPHWFSTKLSCFDRGIEIVVLLGVQLGHIQCSYVKLLNLAGCTSDRR